ncbi:hypothetical protein OHW85_22900, partial [Acinetobacter baumannii]|nr:hypothetical protein [Acinetobacter baumannii]
VKMSKKEQLITSSLFAFFFGSALCLKIFTVITNDFINTLVVGVLIIFAIFFAIKWITADAGEFED